MATALLNYTYYSKAVRSLKASYSHFGGVLTLVTPLQHFDGGGVLYTEKLLILPLLPHFGGIVFKFVDFICLC